MFKFMFMSCITLSGEYGNVTETWIDFVLTLQELAIFYTIEPFSIKNIFYIGKSISMAIGYVK